MCLRVHMFRWHFTIPAFRDLSTDSRSMKEERLSRRENSEELNPSACYALQESWVSKIRLFPLPTGRASGFSILRFTRASRTSWDRISQRHFS